MYTEQLSLNNSFTPMARQAGPTDSANDDGTQATFALLFETALALSDEQCSGSAIGASGNPFDKESDAGSLLTNNDSTGPRSMFDSSTMGRIMARLGPSPVLAQTHASPGNLQTRYELQAATLGSREEQLQDPTQAVGANPRSASVQNVAGSLNKSELSDWMDAHALTRSSHHCAMYCRLGMEAAGLNTGDRPQSGDAGDYGPFLLRHGAQTVPQDSYIPQVGDVVVFNKTNEHPFGHIEMYDGNHWVSDFMQHSLSPYRDAANTPPFTIYRLA